MTRKDFDVLILLLIFSLVILIYIFLMVWLLRAPSREISSVGEGFEPEVAVVIPFRNEEKNLEQLLLSLGQQDYPAEKLQLVFINDHSEDSSMAILEEWRAKFPGIKCILKELGQEKGKKAALHLGIRSVSSDIILQTDADCHMEKNWVRETVRPFISEEVMASAGMVKMCAPGSLLRRFFALEFMSLQASGMLLLKRGLPVMANGANLAYRRKTWLEYHPEEGKWASGDDVFFIQKLAGKHTGAIIFNGRSCVRTETPDTLKKFMIQRIRWGSKTGGYPLKRARYLAYMVAAHNIALLLLFAFGLVFTPYFYSFLAAFFLKSIPEYLVLLRFARQSHQEELLPLFPVASFLYPWYILFTGAAIVLTPSHFRWKGRTILNRP